jgi:olfactory receptor
VPHSFFLFPYIKFPDKTAEGNHFTVTQFILAGLTETPTLQLPFFPFFLGIYVFTVLGNLGMTTLSC